MEANVMRTDGTDTDVFSSYSSTDIATESQTTVDDVKTNVNARLPSRSSSSDGQFEFFITSTTSQ
jgi:hypothetical protein